MKKTLLAAGARAVAMTGSGPTLVGLFGSEKEAGAAHDLLCHRDDITSSVAHTLDTTTLLTNKFV